MHFYLNFYEIQNMAVFFVLTLLIFLIYFFDFCSSIFFFNYQGNIPIYFPWTIAIIAFLKRDTIIYDLQESSYVIDSHTIKWFIINILNIKIYFKLKFGAYILS